MPNNSLVSDYMCHLSKADRLILEIIGSHDGKWNWYKVSRAYLELMDGPSELTLKALLDAGLIEERPLENEPLPRLFVTESGKQVLLS